jgi:hypothetical protein
MSVLDYINKMKEMYEGDRITAQEPRIGLAGGGFIFTTIRNLYKGKKGLQAGRIEKELMRKYRDEGMELIDAVTTANREAYEIVDARKLEIVEDAMTKVDMGSDDYIKLMDEKLRIDDYEMYQDIKRWDSYRPDLADKTRALHFPEWAEARFGENFDEVLLNNQARALKAQSDEINKMYPDKSDTDILVDEIDEMNKANIAEVIEGKKKHAIGGRVGYNDGQLVTPSVDGSRPGYGGKKDEYTRIQNLSVDELKEMGFTGKKTEKYTNPNTKKRYNKLTDEFKTWVKEQTAADPEHRVRDIKFKPRELRVVNAIKKAFEKNDVRYIVSRDNLNKIGNFKYGDYPIITAMKKDPAKLKQISGQTGIVEKDLLNLLEDRKVYIDNKYSDKNRQAWADERTKPKRKFYASAEKWISRNSKRYADPEKFYNAFIRTFGKDNHFIKSIEAGKTTGFKVAFSDEFVDGVLGLKHKTSVNSKQLKDVFKTSIYTNNPNVKKRILDTFNDIIPKDIKYISNLDVRAALIENPLLQKFGINQAIRGPIAKLLADDLIDSIGISLDDISAFRKPWLGTRQLITYLATRVDPKYKSMFEEAGKAVAHAQVNEWSKAKKALNISQNIMFDHKIPQALIKMGFADDLDYIRVTPTLADFNTKVKLFEFDQPMITLANEFKRKGTTDARKLEIYEQMLDTKNKFNSKYGNYLGNMDINYNQKTGKLKLTNVDPILTKKTNLREMLETSLQQEKFQTMSKAEQTKFLNLLNTAKTAKGPGKLNALSALVTMLGAGAVYKFGFSPTEVKAAEAQAAEAQAGETGVIDKAKSWPIEHPWLTGGAATGASKFTKADLLKYFRKVPRKIFSSLGTPTGALASWPLAAMGMKKAGLMEEDAPAFDIKSTGDRIGASAELALAPTLVSWTDKFTKPIKNQAFRSGATRLLNLGMSPAMALRAARVASPIGLLSLAGEGFYHAHKKEMARREELSPKELADFHLERQSRGWSRMKKAGGGMVGIRKPNAIPPERQGLRSIMINVNDD